MSASLYLLQLRFQFFIAVGNLIRKQREIAAENNMRSETDNWLRLAALQQTFEQALEGKLTLREGALVDRSQHFACFNQRHDLLKEIGSDNLHLAEEIQFFQRLEDGRAVLR